MLHLHWSMATLSRLPRSRAGDHTLAIGDLMYCNNDRQADSCVVRFV